MPGSLRLSCMLMFRLRIGTQRDMKCMIRNMPFALLMTACITAYSQDSTTEPKRAPDPFAIAPYRASVMQAVGAVGLHSGQPIGLVLGRDNQRLCRLGGDFDFSRADTLQALNELAEFSGYSFQQDRAAVVLVAPDLDPWQREILTHQFSNFGSARSTMAFLGANLTGWVRTEVGHAQGYGMDIMSSTDDQKLSFKFTGAVSTMEIADRIVEFGDHGIWIMRPRSQHPKGPLDEEIEIVSYHDRPNDIQNLTCGPD